MRNTFEVSPDGYVVGTTAKGDRFIFDIEDFPIVARHTWSINEYGYMTAKTGGKNVRLHRLIAKPREGFEVDHINRVKTDNRKCNLRECTRSQNNQNVGKPLIPNLSTRYKGVSKCKHGKYRAMIGIDRKRVHIGYYDTPEEAARAYNEKAKELHGEFAFQNAI